jgi:hypothetical protein
MNQVIAEVVKKEIVKNSTGRVIGESFVTQRTINVSYIMPSGDKSTREKYGLEVATTHTCLSYEEVDPKSFLKVKNDVFMINYKATFPTHFEYVLEKQ